ncbi:flagellar biosynthetic protein FliR [Leptospira mtsangambouensis]|uniref:flagellar biosynthetic protein FliR n=1 Tax=Leptospira mtsangambouensis TaxID=2484912 RepID=UPI001EEBDD67|nr:flagellar biosynthetic protein FliR [Leptospira mtsangambouensis]MCG6141957.1 flagellar biosynthetic protein FliR [Leptospira mtsangambouensis]
MESFVLHFQSFLFVLVRLLGLFLVAPFFSSESINFSLRMIFSFMVSLIVYPVVATYMPPVPGHMINFGILIISEMLVGVFIGFLVSLVFAAFQMAGEFFNNQIGFGYTEILDPVTQNSLPAIGTMKNLMATALFLVIGAHRFLIETIAYSFEKIRIIAFTGKVNAGLYRLMEEAIGAMFVVSFKIALPVMGILFLVSLAEGLMGKAAQQMNVMSMSFPLKVFIGTLTLIATLTFIATQMVQGIQISMDKASLLIREWPNL